ncbi:hypothetical protein PYW07_014849 [Mythimna separata]|uniref:RRM domain-containing protein n=2 Tax=Obtectomera TaxID=104431 RepID=A0AAD7Z0Q7_MYTSE|nr:hypothetical protein PYW07_014849 [Mythimna separata]
MFSVRCLWILSHSFFQAKFIQSIEGLGLVCFNQLYHFILVHSVHDVSGDRVKLCPFQIFKLSKYFKYLLLFYQYHCVKINMSRYREWDLSCKVYVGNLGTNASKYEIEKVFSKYGNIRNVWVARNPPGFAFVEFEDPRDAEDSVRGLDGTRCCGTRIRVEMSNGRTRRDRRYSRSILSTNHQHTNDLTTCLHHHYGSLTNLTSANAARNNIPLNFCDRLFKLLRAAEVNICVPITYLLTAIT